MPTVPDKSARIPPLNPLRFIPANDTIPGGYNTWPFDRGFFRQQIKTFYQQPADYVQKFNRGDNIFIYFDSLGPRYSLFILDAKGNKVATLEENAIYNNAISGNVDSYFGGQYHTYYKAFNFSGLDLADGYYYVLIQTIYADDDNPDDNTYFVSECFCIRDKWEQTMFLEYANSQGIESYDIYWMESLPIPLGLRCEMVLDIDIAMHDTLFENMFYQMEKLQSVPYRVADLVIGGASGVPIWMLDKINRAIACDTFTLDGVQWQKESGAAWSFKRADNYPMKVGAIKLRDNPENPEWEFNNAGNSGAFRIHDDTFDDTHD